MGFRLTRWLLLAYSEVTRRFKSWRAKRHEAQAAEPSEWLIDCTPLRNIRLGNGMRLRAGYAVSLPAWQAVALHRSGKAHIHLESMQLFSWDKPARDAPPPPPAW
jgi:hypothetical protein